MPHESTDSKKKKPRKLRKLRIDRVSLVDVPAVGGSQFIIAKRGEAAPEVEESETTKQEVESPQFSDASVAINFAIELVKNQQEFNKETVSSCADITKRLNEVADLQANAAELQAEQSEKLESIVKSVTELLQKCEEVAERNMESSQELTKAIQDAGNVLADTNESIASLRERSAEPEQAEPTRKSSRFDSILERVTDLSTKANGLAAELDRARGKVIANGEDEDG